MAKHDKPSNINPMKDEYNIRSKAEKKVDSIYGEKRRLPDPVFRSAAEKKVDKIFGPKNRGRTGAFMKGD